jgi:hypothetical protein
MNATVSEMPPAGDAGNHELDGWPGADQPGDEMHWVVDNLDGLRRPELVDLAVTPRLTSKLPRPESAILVAPDA